MTTTIRISLKTQKSLKLLARTVGIPMQEVVDRAVELYRREQILESANAAYAALRQDSSAWQAWQDEQKTWDATLLDGLEKH